MTGGGYNNYGVQFDAWYNDHFFGRDAMTGLYQNIKYFIAPMVGNDKVLVGKDGWLFSKLNNNSMNNYANNTILSEYKLQQGLNYLIAIDSWCKKKGKEFYYVIAPDKSKIYGEYYRLIKKQRADEYGIGNQFANYIKKNSNIKVIYLRDVLIKNKDKGLLYYKLDTHWNDLGAYYGYKALMKLMKMPEKSYEFDKVSYDSHQHINMGYSGTGDLDRMLGSVFLKDSTMYHKLKQKNKSLCKSYNINARRNECNNINEKKNLYMLRDSFGGALLYYLSYDFNKIHTNNNMDSISVADLKDIEQNYDIVILENVERYIPQILNKKFPQNLIKEN
ncbi:MAG: hypothetical protein IJ677_01280 [Alphaproteobacteria bacterium]|nr:hypothetical protein [Alphaproteobacteria bacterium]